MIETGKIVIKDKVYFEPDGLEKPNVKIHSRGGLFNAMKEYEASKQLIEVSNWIKIDGAGKKCQLLLTKMRIASKFIPDKQPCKAEVTDKATIIELL